MGEKPASSPDLPESPSARKRKRIGWWLTSAWGLVSVAIALATWDSTIKFHDLMEAVAAAFGPIALLWLILGYQQQGEELALQRQELELQRRETARLADEARSQSESLKLAEHNARRDTFLRVYELTLPSLVSCAFRIGRELEASAIFSAATQHANGETEAIFDLCVNLLRTRRHPFTDGSRISADVQESAVRFLSTFEDLLSQAQEADPAGSIRRNLENSGLGSLYIALAFVSNWDIKLQFRKRPSGVDQLRY